VLERDDCSVRMLSHLDMFVKNQMVHYAMKLNGSNGCHVAFVAKEYATSDDSSHCSVQLCLACGCFFFWIMRTGLHLAFIVITMALLLQKLFSLQFNSTTIKIKCIIKIDCLFN